MTSTSSTSCSTRSRRARSSLARRGRRRRRGRAQHAVHALADRLAGDRLRRHRRATSSSDCSCVELARRSPAAVRRRRCGVWSTLVARARRRSSTTVDAADHDPSEVIGHAQRAATICRALRVATGRTVAACCSPSSRSGTRARPCRRAACRSATSCCPSIRRRASAGCCSAPSSPRHLPGVDDDLSRRPSPDRPDRARRAGRAAAAAAPLPGRPSRARRQRHRLVGEGDNVQLRASTRKGSRSGPGARRDLRRRAARAASRPVVAPVLHKAMRWRGPIGPALIAHLAGAAGARRCRRSPTRRRGRSTCSASRSARARSTKREVTAQLPRRGCASSIPTTAATEASAGKAIADLDEARRILLGKSDMSAVLLFPGAGTDATHPSPACAIERGGRPDAVRARRLPVPQGRAARRPTARRCCWPPCATSSTPSSACTADRSCWAGARWAGGCARWSPPAPTGSAAAPSVAGLVLICYPLHPPGKPDQLRVEHLPAITVPCLFVSRHQRSVRHARRARAVDGDDPRRTSRTSGSRASGHDLKGADAHDRRRRHQLSCLLELGCVEPADGSVSGVLGVELFELPVRGLRDTTQHDRPTTTSWPSASSAITRP